MKQPHLVVLSGAGVSAESGLKTFRDNGGLWDGYDVKEVATWEAWNRNPELVLRFYNERRRALHQAEPNLAHQIIAQLESDFNVSVVTQNVDDLHEAAGSSNVLHLHGELKKARSTIDESLIYEIEGTELTLGQHCELGSQLRPHIVWFGEAVPLTEEAAQIVRRCEALIVVGTSLVVYPAAGLVGCVRPNTPIWVVDPAAADIQASRAFAEPSIRRIARPATSGMPLVAAELRAYFT